jgi:acid stress chaperone HdeB
LTRAGGKASVEAHQKGNIDMRLLRTLAVAAAFAVLAPVAQAQKVDLSKTSCKEFLESGKEGIMIVWSWLYGYYSDQDADPVIDFDELVKHGQKLADYCKANPAVDIIKAAEPIYEK